MAYLSRFLPWLVLVLVGFAAPELRATYTQLPADRRGSTIDPVVLKAYRWRSIGPDRGGRSIAVAGVKGRPKEAYFGADRRRAVEDDRRRRDLGAGHRRPDPQFVGRRGRGLRVESRRRLHRHGRIVHPRQHHARRRRLQVHRRRQDVDARRLRRRPTRSRRSASTRPTPTSSSSPTSASTARRATSAASSRAPTAARPGSGCCSATTRPARSTSRSIARTRT